MELDAVNTLLSFGRAKSDVFFARPAPAHHSLPTPQPSDSESEDPEPAAKRSRPSPGVNGAELARVSFIKWNNECQNINSFINKNIVLKLQCKIN